jgi:thiosulfate/3-mercaptopyruvate sulfurtransferase
MSSLKFFVISTIITFGLIDISEASPLVDSAWLMGNINNGTVVIIDLRNKIDKGSLTTFLKGHIPGSVHSDYLKDGWRISKNGIIGLLPSAEKFQALARRLGVYNDSHVVLIPAGVSSTDFGSSARAYWTFKVFGHSKVSILEGGYNAWRTKFPNFIEQSKSNKIREGDFLASFNSASYISTKQVAEIVNQKKNVTLIDARNNQQFIGEGKHKAIKLSGHLPGATFLSETNSYDQKSNSLKKREQLAQLFSVIDIETKPTVSYCYTGHWAAINWFILSEVLGKKDTRLYDGSMVEWSADSANNIVYN